MLTLSKTSLILLLFTAGITYFSSGNPLRKNQDGKDMSVQDWFIPKDTVTTEKKEINPNVEFKIPDNFARETIHFQVNSAISYLSFNHFALNESKKLFFQAWLKEKEITNLSAQTDSLRKAYANASSDQKEAVSAQILKAEKRTLALNEKIPVLYEKARDEENRHWQSVSADEVSRFQEKIRLFKDSIRQISDLKNGQAAIVNPKIPDTITYYKSSQKAVVKTDAASGIIYKIQVGAYKGKVPESAAKSIKKLSVIRKVEKLKDEKGITLYTTGSLKDYQQAVILQNQVKQEGIKNATITAYQNGKKIPLDEARKINNEL